MKRNMFSAFCVLLIYLATASAQTSLIEVFKTVEQETIWATSTGRLPNTDTVTLTVNAFGDSVVASIPTDVMLVVDRSTSMVWDDDGNELPGGAVNPLSRLANAAHACSSFSQWFLSDTTVENRLAIQYFWGLRESTSVIPRDPDWKQKFTFNDDLTAALAYLGDTLNAPGTYILTALDSALKYTYDNRRSEATTAIIFLSDGQGYNWEQGEERYGISPPYPSRATMEQLILQRVMVYSAIYGIKVYPIGFGSAASYALLDSIASRSGTTVRFTTQGSDLDEIYQDIAKELRTYAVARVSPSDPLIVDQIPTYVNFLSYWQTGNNNTPIDGFTSTGNVLSWDVPEIEIDSTFEVSYNIQSDQPGWNNLFVGTNNMVNYLDARGDPGSIQFPRRRTLVLELIQNNAALLLDAQALSWQSIRVLVDTSKFASMAIDTVRLYYSSSGYVTDLAASHINIPVQQLRTGGGWYTVTGLNELTTYYFTAAFRNYVGEYTNLSASRGQSRATLFHCPNTIAIVTAATGGTGQVSSATVTTDDNLHYYAAGYDGGGAYIRNYAVDWYGPFFGINSSAVTDVTFSPDSVGSGGITISLPETTCSVTDYTATLNVSVGTVAYIRINSGSGGGSEVADQGIASDQTLTLWAGAYDADGNYISDVSAAWSVTGDLQSGDLSAATGTNITYTPSATSATGGYIIATASGVTDSVHITSIFSGTVTKLRIRDAAGGAGSEVDTFSLVAGYSRTLYLAAYDINDTYLSDVSGTWSSLEQTPSFSYTASGSQYDFSPLQAGAGRLVATFNGTVSDSTGLVTVLGAEPDSLAITYFPPVVTAGVPFNNVVVNAWDELGNPTSQYTATNVIWQFTDPSASDYGYTITTPDPTQTFTNGVLDSSTLAGFFRMVNSGTNSVRIGVVVGPGDTVWSAYTPNFSVVPGDGYKVEIRTLQYNYTPPDTLPVQKVLTDVLTLYAGVYDAMGNHIEDTPVFWTNQWLYPAITGQNTSITQTYTLAGVDTIRISHADYENDRIAVRIVDAAGPRIIGGWAYDASGDGYVDSFVVKFNEVLDASAAVSVTGLSLKGMNTFILQTITVNAADSSVSITARNNGVDLATYDERKNQDSGNPPQLIISVGNQIADTSGNYAVPDTFDLDDRAGPALHMATLDDGGTDNDPSDDILTVQFSEPISDSSWGGGVSGISMRVDSLLKIIGLGSFGSDAHIRTGDAINDDIVEVFMGSDGTPLTPGGDSVGVVADYDICFADLNGNRTPVDNGAILVHMPWSDKLIMDMVNYPNPFRATTGGSFAQSGPQPYGTVASSYTKGDATLIKYTLSKHGNAELTILSSIGTLVDRFTMDSGEPGGHEGVNYFYWNGRNGKGRVVESGSYIVILKVVATEDGTTGKVVRRVGVIRDK